MKEIISFFTLAFTSFKFIRRYLDGKRTDYYTLVFFNIVFSFICGASIFYVDAILWNEVNQNNLYFNILIVSDLLIVFFLVAVFSATYGISLNHFIMYVDNENSIFERKSRIFSFNNSLLKVRTEADLLRKHIRKNNAYEYIYNYQIENFEYIDQESKKYKEFACQWRQFNYQRLFKYNTKIKLYFRILIALFLMTLIISYFQFFILVMIITHILIYILSIGFLSKISVSLHRENDKDKIKLMRYLRSQRY